jgi:hypothetical protein
MYVDILICTLIANIAPFYTDSLLNPMQMHPPGHVPAARISGLCSCNRMPFPVLMSLQYMCCTNIELICIRSPRLASTNSEAIRPTNISDLHFFPPLTCKYVQRGGVAVLSLTCTCIPTQPRHIRAITKSESLTRAD